MYDDTMTREELRELMQREPFRPFRVRASSGRAAWVVRPELAVLMKSGLFVAEPDSDRSVFVPYLDIAGIEEAMRGESSAA